MKNDAPGFCYKHEINFYYAQLMRIWSVSITAAKVTLTSLDLGQITWPFCPLLYL